MRQWMVSILVVFLAALLAAGCGGDKKKKGKTAKDVDAGADASIDEEAVDEEAVDEEGAEEAAELEPEPEPEYEPPQPEPEYASPAPAKFPPHPANNHSGRSPQEYLMSIRKAQIVPAKPDGSCWDDCSGEAQQAIGAAAGQIGALGGTEQGSFDTAAKLLSKGIGFLGGNDAFPDVFINIRCGHGQGHQTNKKSAKNKIAPTWSYENKKLELDNNDKCAISVWDSDDEGDEEIGRATVKLAQLANQGGGKALIYGANEGFGLVYSLEISLKPYEEAKSGGSGGGGSGGGAAPKGSYSIEIIKAKIKDKKKDGQPWDKPLPMLGGADPDVFVAAWINGYKSSKPFLSTSVVKESYSPSWDEGAPVSMGVGDFINFMVWDKDAADDDLIGECKTKQMGVQSKGEIWLKDCGQVESLVVKITQN